MSFADIFEERWAQAVLTGFRGLNNFENIVTIYDDLERQPGANIVFVPVWSSFTVKRMGEGCLTPCSATKQCDEMTATLIPIPLMTSFIPTGICLSDFNLFTPLQHAGAVARMIQDLKADFETANGVGMFDKLWTDAVFNGAGGGNAPIVLADTAAGYRQFAHGLALMRAKAGPEGIALVVPPMGDAFIRTIPDRDVRLVTDEQNYTIMGNAATFARVYGGTTYTGRIGFAYPLTAVAYASTRIVNPPNSGMAVAGNFYTAWLDDPDIPGRMFFVCHQYGYEIVRRGDVQALLFPA